MFKKKNIMGVAALSFLSEEVKALKNGFRPIPGTNPWHKPASHST